MLPDHVFVHIQEKCNLEPIKDVLRYIKESVPAASKEIVLGSTKEESIGNLKRAHALDYCTEDEVLGLLIDAEECGRQHVLLLTPATDSEMLVDLTAHVVANKLFDHPVDEIFPRFEYPSSGYSWADFRIESDGGWTAKAYGLELVKVSFGVSTEELPDGRFQETREYAYKEVKTTSVVRWRPSSRVLELRIDCSALSTADVLPRRREAIWTILSNAIQKEQFVGLNVENLLTRLLDNREIPENADQYSVSRVELTDPRSGLIRVIPCNSEAFDMEPGRRKSLEAMRNASFQPSLVRVEWLSTFPNVPRTMTEPVQIVLEKTENGPELRMLKRVTREIYEYVFHQLSDRLHG